MNIMIENAFDRTRLLFGDAAMKKLQESRVIVFGLGGVGGYAVEALCRSGIGALDLVDSDRISITNLNRQILATTDTVGQDKTEAARARVLSINPDCQVRTYKTFLLPETADQFDLTQYDYIVDAIDTVTAKLLLAEEAQKKSVPILSCMGTGNKLDPSKLVVTDLYKTSVCPLAKVMRSECRKRGISHLKVVYSTEIPLAAHRPPASTAFVPPAAGLLAASEVVRDLISDCL